jgi:hypothetical protein
MVKRYYSFAAIYLFTFAALGTLLPMIGQYLAHIGFSGVQIGIITATGTAVGIGASPFWDTVPPLPGHFHHPVVSVRFGCAACHRLSFIKVYQAFLLLFALFSFFQSLSCRSPTL